MSLSGFAWGTPPGIPAESHCFHLRAAPAVLSLQALCWAFLQVVFLSGGGNGRALSRCTTAFKRASGLAAFISDLRAVPAFRRRDPSVRYCCVGGCFCE